MITPGHGEDRPAGLVLIEPHAHRAGGHWRHALPALAGSGVPVVAVVLNGISPGNRTALFAAGATVTTHPPARCTSGWALLAAGRAVDRCARILLAATRRNPRWPVRLRRFPHQITMVSRCLVEAASLRTGRMLAPAAPQIVLTASETLHSLAAAWGNAAHVRIVHELYTTEDFLLRALGATVRRHRDRVALLCPTPGVRDAFITAFPGMTSMVMPFALTAPTDYMSDNERRAARAALPGETPVAVLIGGWWPHKDPATVIDAFRKTDRPWQVIVAGTPVDPTLLAHWDHMTHLTVTVHARDVESDELRRLYAAADVTIVSRVRGATATKESGLLMDAVRYGVPVLISDHDPALTSRLRAEPWVRIFGTGDSGDLAGALRSVADAPLPRPQPGDAARLGLSTPAHAAVRFAEIHDSLAP
ncbi:hypothetical protein [Cryptosporangium sp. NPDC048952]|uniref:hypothetical protein n=1 Tax=Cryptosporangium sp. NPDC048952 TaxID=3363961 RepID=UPI00371357A5